ncbi:MAG TPA: NTF2-like N-terminal transpeptidase domain-containing protein, partial [Chloroflexota bacterium]|nr:NTF2-like N-terminal transpeptidase domain-containing protein [Chloroflexota bacterium]
MKRVRWLVGALAVVCIGGLLPACAGGSGNGVSRVVDAYLRAWRRHDYRAMAKLVDRPPADFVAFNRAVVTDLGIERADYVRGRTSQHGRKASVSLRNRFVVRGLGTWRARGELSLIERRGRWRIDWSPRAIHVGLQPGSHPVRKTQWPDRAPILGAGGAALTMATPMVTVGVQGSRVTDAGVLTSALQGA